MMTDKAMLDDLAEAATQFRHMIENADRSKLPVEFKNFPGESPASCHHENPYESGGRVETPILLAQYLIDLGYLDYGIPHYVRGELYEPRLRWGHAWIELNGIKLDIALDGLWADQPPVIVTEDSYWHEMFRRLDANPVAIHVFDKRTVAMLRTAYHEIIGLRTH